jgi:hypothetical protein
MARTHRLRETGHYDPNRGHADRSGRQPGKRSAVRGWEATDGYHGVARRPAHEFSRRPLPPGYPGRRR